MIAELTDGGEEEEMLGLLLQSSGGSSESGAAAVLLIFGLVFWLLAFWGLHALAHLMPFPGKSRVHGHEAHVPSWRGGTDLPPAP